MQEIDCNGPGLRRRRAGTGFTYLDDAGKRITEAPVLERIRSLAIPPVWEDMWICPDADGHIQAVGIDATGRRQHRYHDEWREARDSEKRDGVLSLAKRLPELRARVEADLTRDGMPRERVLAAAVRLLTTRWSTRSRSSTRRISTAVCPRRWSPRCSSWPIEPGGSDGRRSRRPSGS